MATLTQPSVESPPNGDRPPRLPALRSPVRLLVFAFLGIAACRHVMGLGERSLWFDEAFSWRLTRFPWAEMIARAGQDVHPPFYYVILKVWTALLGDSVLVMRLLSVLWFGLGLSMAYLICREAAIPSAGPAPGKKTRGPGDAGLFAVLLLASGPLFYRYHQEARMYAQEVALVLTSNWLLLRALRGPKSPGYWWAGYILAATALCYTHYFGLLSVAAQLAFTAGWLARTWVASAPPLGRRKPLPQWFWLGVTALGYAHYAGLLSVAVRLALAAVLLAWTWRAVAPPRERRSPPPQFFWAVGSSLLILALYLPWLPTLLRQQSRVAQDYWSKSISESSPIRLDFWGSVARRMVAYEPDQATASLTGGGSGVTGEGLLLAGVVVLLMLASRRDRVGWLVVAGVVVPILLSVAISYKNQRNFIEPRFLIPSFALLLVGLALALNDLRPVPVRRAACGLILAFFVYGTWRYAGSLGRPVRPEYRGAADHIAEGIRPGDLVLCAGHSCFFPLSYHARGRFPVYQARYPGLVVNHYSGGPIFRREDFRDWGGAVRSEGGRLWILGPRAAYQSLQAPEGRELLERVDFPETIRWQGDIVLELWGRREKGSTAPGTSGLSDLSGRRVSLGRASTPAPTSGPLWR